MVELTNRAIDAALERGRITGQAEPRAVAARYDREPDRIIVDLANGTSFTFPPPLVQGLAGANPEALAQVELLGDGYALHWDRLDVDITVPGLVSGIFGTARWMAAHAGRATSAAKAEAARANGAKGGRPRKDGPRDAMQTQGRGAMAKDRNLPQFHLTKDAAKGDWALRKAGAERATRRFDTKTEATAGGVLSEAVGKGGGSVRIHLESGRIQEERTFPRGRDPKQSPG